MIWKTHHVINERKKKREKQHLISYSTSPKGTFVLYILIVVIFASTCKISKLKWALILPAREECIAVGYVSSLQIYNVYVHLLPAETLVANLRIDYLFLTLGAFIKQIYNFYIFVFSQLAKASYVYAWYYCYILRFSHFYFSYIPRGYILLFVYTISREKR